MRYLLIFLLTLCLSPQVFSQDLELDQEIEAIEALETETLEMSETTDEPPQEAPYVTEPVPSEPTPIVDSTNIESEDTSETIETKQQSTNSRISEQREKIEAEENRIQKLNEQIGRTRESQRQRRLLILKEQERVRALQRQERLKNRPPPSKQRLSKKKKEIIYPRTESPQHFGSSLRFGVMPSPTIENPESGNSFDDIYGNDNKFVMNVDFEWQFFKSFGKLGLKAGSGLLVASGSGRFKNPELAGIEAEEKYTFLMFPNNLGGIYRLDYFKNQYVVPYAEGGIGYYTFTEVRDDFKRTKFGGAPVVHWAGGIAISLNWLDRAAIARMDEENGINHLWLTLEYRNLIGLSDRYDFTNSYANAGFFFEF